MRPRRAMKTTSLFFLSFALSSVACVRQLPPPPPPALHVPEGAVTEDTASGFSRLTISTDVPARVERIAGVPSHRGPMRELLCSETPCTVTLPYGDHELEFEGLKDGGRRSSTVVRLATPNEVLEHTLGTQRSSAGQVLGFMLITAGLATIITVGALASSDRRAGSPDDSALQIGAGIGAGGLVLGGALMAASPGTRQDGATSHAPIVGGSVGVHF